MSPPPPRPCRARVPISWDMFCDMPARIDPITNTTTADCNMSLRPYRSESFPQIGVLAVDANR